MRAGLLLLLSFFFMLFEARLALASPPPPAKALEAAKPLMAKTAAKTAERAPLKAGPSKQKPKSGAGDDSKDDSKTAAGPFQACLSSGGEVLLRESARLDFYIKFNSFNSENIKKVADAIMAARGKNSCPAGFLQKNSFKSYVTVRHASTVSGGCPADQGRESYSFKKEFSPKTGSRPAGSAKNGGKASKKASMLESGRQMNKWLAKTFVYPYLPFPLRSSTKEHRQTLKSACPSCSFQLAYEYVFAADGSLSLDLNVKCGALKESMLSPLKIELTVKNRCRCIAKN